MRRYVLSASIGLVLIFAAFLIGATPLHVRTGFDLKKAVIDTLEVTDAIFALKYWGWDVTGADSFWIYDNGTNTIFDADNPIQIGTNELVTAYVDSAALGLDVDTTGTKIAAALGNRFSTGDYAMGALKGIGGTAYADTIVDASITTGSAVNITVYGAWAGVPQITLEAGRAIVTSSNDADSTVMRVSGYAYLVKY